MVVTNASGLVIWESLVPLAASLGATPGRSGADTRSVLDTRHPAIRHAIGVAKAKTLRELGNTLRQPLGLWTARERDLIAAVRDRHARLSAGLVQGALFDRRHERLAAAQAALLDEVLSRSALRLDELAANADARADACDLAFAVIVE